MFMENQLSAMQCAGPFYIHALVHSSQHSFYVLVLPACTRGNRAVLEPKLLRW